MKREISTDLALGEVYRQILSNDLFYIHYSPVTLAYQTRQFSFSTFLKTYNTLFKYVCWKKL